MHNKLATQQYSNIHITTVDRGRLLLMLYDGCIKFLKHAKAGAESKDIPKFCRFLSKAQAIISELMLTLDFEKGGEIAKDLDRLYDFLLFYLTEANIEKNPAKVQRAIDILETIAGAYRDIIEGGKVGKLEAAELPSREVREPGKPTAENKQPGAVASEPLPGTGLRLSL